VATDPAGVLVLTDAQIDQILRRSVGSYARPKTHIEMLNDRGRVTHYLRAIRQTVRQDDLVLDIGTGTGLLAVAAAQAGARHVYAIESSAIAKSAEAVFRANDVADRITLIEGYSTQISLPERANVLVSELIGNDPLAEAILEVTRDAKERLLTEDARLVPNRLKVFGLPVTLPTVELNKRTFQAESVAAWRNWYGIDFSPLAQVGRTVPQSFPFNPALARHWKILGDPLLLTDLDFATLPAVAIDTKATMTTKVSGQLDAILLFFELELASGINHSTHPACVRDDNHWQSPLWILPEPLPVKRGDRLQLEYEYDGFLKLRQVGRRSD
jgi:SAM-dependent methyltransferase